MDTRQVHDAVADYYRKAALEGTDYEDDDRWGIARYDDASLAGAPESAAALSMGCGNPFVLADLGDGDVVLDLGSGGGLDVILSAQRVAPSGHAYGVDMLEEMIDHARRHAVEAGVDNVTFLQGMMEEVPLADASVDVVISNCVISLAPDKKPVFAEMFRVLRPGGRFAVSDVIARRPVEAAVAPGSWVECGEGALTADEYRDLLTAAGFVDVTVELTHETGPGFDAGMVRGRKA